ncbi:hypothetical protein I316_06393 [Kwoniella heveanensis BCC8398]|uniref:L-mandelate dehydrogenase n=1 Tax=Kwoniella heveanensis BCC8398 TaxID=1296120 RepID=A0A1B9GLU9_9TREE|nr:hypothetical protein I316_06393 [Kwoniella heveanensis BCC8398]
MFKRLGVHTSRVSRSFFTRHLSTYPAGPSRSTHIGWTVAGGVILAIASYETIRSPVSLEEESPVTVSKKHGHTADPTAPTEYITLKEVAKHNLSQDAWVIINGKVYDVTNFHQYHPGGAAVILSNAGSDVSSLFNSLHPPGTIENNLSEESFKGWVDPEITAKAVAAQDAEKARVAAARGALPPVETILGIEEFEEAADSVMSRQASAYYHTGALDGISHAGNKDAFRKCRIVPRVMRDVSRVEPQTTIFGIPSALPIYISPSSNALLGHPDGELNMTRGAAKTGIVQGVSYVASYPLKDILAEKEVMDELIGEKMGMVFQVYVREDREKNAEVIREAIEGGCQALLLTVDSNVGDHRQSVEKMKGTTGSAEEGRKFGPFTKFTHGPHDPRLNWKDLDWLKAVAGDVPIYLKGVSHIEDIKIAKEHGVKGCILSNHGGRQLDRARSGFDSLRRIHDQEPSITKEMEIYVDGGVRRGTDVLMALALGARGVGLGRPFLFAQAAYGEKGTIRAVRILENEIVTAMQLMGISKLDQLRPEMIECLQEVWK